jgi:hypothetical protein
LGARYTRGFAAGGFVDGESLVEPIDINTQQQINTMMSNGGLASTGRQDLASFAKGGSVHDKLQPEFEKRGLDYEQFVNGSKKNDKTYFRGMSNREYRSLKKTGHIKSTGEYNVGSMEKGLTFFSKDPAEAAFYAHEYAPLKYKATATKPAYVVEAKINDSKKKIDAPGGVGVSGKIHEKNVISVHRGRPTEDGMEWTTIHSSSDPVKKIHSIAVLSRIRKGM